MKKLRTVNGGLFLKWAGAGLNLAPSLVYARDGFRAVGDFRKTSPIRTY